MDDFEIILPKKPLLVMGDGFFQQNVVHSVREM